MSMGTFATANVYCDMTTDNGGWIVIQRNRKNSEVSFKKTGENMKKDLVILIKIFGLDLN